MRHASMMRRSLIALVTTLLWLPAGLAIESAVAAQDEGINDAVFVRQTVPATMTAGQAYAVSVTMQNVGTTTWTKGSGYKLGSQNPPDNLTWGLSRVLLATGKPVRPGQTVTFQFTVTAPASSGLYDFQWQMLNERTGTAAVWFGAMSANLTVNVTGGTGGADNALYVSRSVPTTMTAGQSYAVSVVMQNSGTTTWQPGSYALVSQTPPQNMTWGLNRVELASAVAPGGSATFGFDVTAPAAAGLYVFQWEMYKDGFGFFGETTPATQVAVIEGPGLASNAACVLQNVPATVTVGQTFGVEVVMANTGETTWSTATGYQLGSQSPAGSTTWGTNHIDLAGSVPPGSQGTFLVNVTAPLAAGTYDFQWQMLRIGVGYFGELTPGMAIAVVPAPGHDEEGLGNNLSVPTVFAEGYGITGLPTATDTGLRPRPVEPNVAPYFDPTVFYVADGQKYSTQQSPSTWQATWFDGAAWGEDAVVNWSDNLLSQRWTPSSVIRVETILYKNPTDRAVPGTAYPMRLLYGAGPTEMHGTLGIPVEQEYRTVFSVNARLKIEKLDAKGGTPVQTLFDGAVYEGFGTDGPGSYGSEINVSGNLIYGYNWMLNQAPGTIGEKSGWYRLTFSFDPMATYTIEGVTYTVPCGARMVAQDPGDLAGRYFVPTLPSSTETVLEIDVQPKSGSGVKY